MGATGDRAIEGRLRQMLIHSRLDRVRSGVVPPGDVEHGHHIDARGVTFSHEG